MDIVITAAKDSQQPSEDQKKKKSFTRDFNSTPPCAVQGYER